jgi:sugar O-acyltransferase (sialic acid O-acetyltransferase NeuD family)
MGNVILWGALGQAKVVRPILEADGNKVIAVFDNDLTRTSPFPDVPFCGDWSAFMQWRDVNTPCGFVVCIGGVRGAARVKISEDLEHLGFQPVSAIHRRAWLSETAKVGRGTQLMALSGVSELAELGAFCIINTNATVDHDTRLGNGVHLMPGASVAGEVEICDLASVGTNATVLPRVRIGAGAIVGAGAVVTKDVAPGTVVTGCPARPATMTK